VTEPEPGTREGHGLFASLRRVLATLIELVHTRLELVGVELQVEVQRAASLLLWAFGALLCAIVAVVLLAGTVMIALWDTHRLLAAGCVTAFFAVAALGSALYARHRVRTRPHMFAGSLGELKRDVATLTGRQP
jgi:uncharacterized membrane protein YqjE